MSEVDQDKENPVDPVSEDIRAGWPSPGKKLEKIRQEMGLSHARVAEALHMTAHYVKALENDEYDKLPGKTFVKGYFKAYAQLLGTDVDAIMNCYTQYMAALEESEESEAKVIRAKKAYDQNIRWMICAAIIIVLVVGISWWMSRKDQVESSAAPSNINTNSTLGNSDNAESNDIEPAALTADQMVARARSSQSPEHEVEAQDESSPLLASEDAVEESDQTSLSARTSEQEPKQVILEQVPELSVEVLAATQPEELAEQTLSMADDNDVSVDMPDAADESVISESVLPDYTVSRLNNYRQVQLESDGEDLLNIHFSGSSWIEVDNGENTRLYHDMLNTGDDLTIKGRAPFNILIGDATAVDVTFNSRAVDIQARIRTDNSARIILEQE